MGKTNSFTCKGIVIYYAKLQSIAFSSIHCSVLIIEDIITNYENKSETPVVKDVVIKDGVVTLVDPNEKLKHLEEWIDGSPAINYEQTHTGY